MASRRRLKQQFAFASHAVHHQRRRRPTLEVLEVRALLSTFTVNSLGDAGSGSADAGDLRYCINQANADDQANTIVFDSTVFGTPQTITLSGSQLELSDTGGTQTITGPAAGVTISGGGNSRVFEVDSGVTASLSGLTISGGSWWAGPGGGIANYGTATLTGCTLSGNTAMNGGGVFNSGYANLTLTDCTLSGNYGSGGSGGGVYNSGKANLNLTDCTLSGNSVNGYFLGVGGGVANYGTANLTGTIVAGNGDSDIGGTSDVSGSYNLIGSGAGGLVNGVNGNLVGVYTGLGTLVLGTLGNYGGPTETIPLLPGCPALGAGIAVAGVTTDQRGEPLDTSNPDIGAFQSQGFTVSLAAGSTPQTAAISTAFPNPLALSVTANNPVEPVDGGVITFVAPPVTSGASALLSASYVVIAGGHASVNAMPSNMDGSYTVTASASGASRATFNLTNTGPAFAQLIVNTTSGSLLPGAGLLSLPEAVLFANIDNSGSANITFDPNVFNTPQTITLAGTELELSNKTETETITAPAAGVTISGGGNSRVFEVDPRVTASISGLTISGGSWAGPGGGMANYGTATLTDCTVNGNSSGGADSSGSAGGGVFNSVYANLTLTDCTVSGNSAYGGGGGGVGNYGGTITLTNCTLSGNSESNSDGGAGGGVFSSSGTVDLTDCTISGNYAADGGGGLASGASFFVDTANLTDTIVAGNTDPSGPSDILANSNISGSYNLIGTGGSGGLVNGVDGNIVLTSLTELGLAALGNNGGLTQTMALLAGSPAIGAGVIADYPGTTSPITTDQRGEPLDFPNPDIGAYQTQGSTSIGLTFSGISDKSIIYGTSSVTISGTLANGSQAPVGETVAVTLDRVQQSATIGSGGAFSTTFDTAGLTVANSPYMITYVYISDGTFTSAGTTSTLTVTPAALTIFTVNGLGDAGIGSGDSGDLRYCINQANADGGANQIVFDPTVFSTPQAITLSGGQLELEDTGGAQTITGPDAAVTISGGGKSRVFQVDGGVTASISGLTISGGSPASGAGGGLANGGTVTLTDCTLSGNTAFTSGGGLSNVGTATLTGCTLSGNYVHAVGGGGGGVSNGGTADLTDCTVSGNSVFDGFGGGMYNNAGTAYLTDCTVSGNSATDGGGLANYTYWENPDGPVTLTDTIVAGNTDPWSNPNDIFGSDISGSFNLIGTGGSAGLVNGVNGNIVLTSLTDLGLAPLGNNGGPTQTMAVLPGSAAIGAGVIADYAGTTTPITTDQRGDPLDSPNPDIGAYQTQGSTLIALSFSGISDQSITYGTSSVTISGTLADGSQAPVGETVAVTLDGDERPATIGSGGAFSTTFDTSGLTVSNSPDTITYAYTSDGSFASAGNTSTLTVNPATLTITANPETKVYGTADPALAYTASGFQLHDTAASVLAGSLARAGRNAGRRAGGELRDQPRDSGRRQQLYDQLHRQYSDRHPGTAERGGQAPDQGLRQRGPRFDRHRSGPRRHHGRRSADR